MAMSDTVTIDRTGRLVLPKAIRDRFRLVGGSQIEVQIVGDHVELKPVTNHSEGELIEKNGILVIRSNDSEFDATDAVKADRREREQHLS